MKGSRAMTELDQTAPTRSVGLPALLPRDHETGQFISRRCPECDDGMLQYEDGWWRCDGLIDPENTTQPLQPCMYSIEAG